MTTTTHRTDEFTIVRDVAALIQDTEGLPSWGGNNLVGWTTPFSTAWNEGAKAICEKHGITPKQFLGFVSMAREYLEAVG
jgi:hypothetical protein